MDTEDTRNGLTFKQWMREVDAEVDKLTGGMSQYDFADWPSWSTWDSGCDPEEGAIECLEFDDIGKLILEQGGAF
jgi:hypothetical protein